MLTEFYKKINLVYVVVVLSFLLSIFYSFWHHIPPVVDAKAYDNIAVNLVNGFGFKEDPNKTFQFDTAIVRAGPAYEFFLAGLYKIFGHRYEIVWLVQAVLHAGAAWLLYLISKNIFSQRGEVAGLIAAALFGLHPDLIEISAMLMTETLYLFLVILTIWLFIKIYQTPTDKYLSVYLGLILGLAILSRPPVLLFIPIIAVFYILNRRYQEGVICGIVLFLVLLPWTIRNYIIFHQFILTTLIGQYNLWVGNTLLSDGGQISGGFNALITYTEAHGFFDLKNKAGQEFWLFVINYPLVFLKLCMVRFIRFFSLIRPMGFWFYQNGWPQLLFVVSSALAIVVLFVSGFTGILLAKKERYTLFNYLILLALTSPLVLIPTVVQSRYRFQIYPFLALFGGYFLSKLFNLDSCKAVKKQFLFVFLFFILISLADILINLPFILDRIASLV